MLAETMLTLTFLREGALVNNHILQSTTLNYIRGGSRKRRVMQENEAPLEYKQAMGAGVNPDDPNIPLKFFFGAIALLIGMRPEVRVIPLYIWKGLTTPGALSGMSL